MNNPAVLAFRYSSGLMTELFLSWWIPAWGMHDYMVPMDTLCYIRPGCVLYVCANLKTTIYKCAQAFTSLTWQFSSVFYLGLKVHKGEVRIKAWHYPIKRRAEIATPKVLLNLGKSYSIFPLHLWMVLMAYFTFKIRHFCPAWNKVKEII